MKSVKQQFIDLQEGKMSQQNFMRNLRMTMPQYVTNVTSFKDSVRILKNKGILSEADIKLPEMTVSSAVEGVFDGDFDSSHEKLMKAKEIISTSNHPDKTFALQTIEKKLKETSINESEKFSIAVEDEISNRAEKGKITKAEADTAMDFISNNDLELEEFEFSGQGEAGGGVMKAVDFVLGKINKSIKEAQDSSEGKWKTVTGKDLYAQFKEIDNLNGQEVLIGIDYEIEKNHDLTKAEAAKIVVKNLKKNPIYYTASLMAGKEGFEPGYIGGKSANAEARQMQPLEKNMSNVVDKKMGMQPVKNVEKVKKDSDKGGEANKTVKGVSLMSLVAKTVRGLKKMDATGEKMKKVVVKEEKMPFQDLPAGAKYNIKKDSRGNIVQATNDKGNVFSKNDEAIAIDNKQKIQINSFIEQQGKVKAIYDNYALPIDIDGLKPTINQSAIAKALTKDDLMEMIREELEEALGIGGTDSVNFQQDDTANESKLDEVSSFLSKIKDKITNSSLFKKLIDTIVSKMSDKDIATFKAKFNLSEAKGGPSLEDIMSKVDAVNPDKNAKTPEDLKEALDEDTLGGKIASLIRGVVGINLLALGGAPLGMFINYLLGISVWSFGAFVGPVISLVASLIIHGISSRLLGKTDDDSMI